MTVLPVAAAAALAVMPGYDACDNRWSRGGGEVVAIILCIGQPWQVGAPNPMPYLPAGDTWPIQDPTAPALLPGYTLAQVHDGTLTAFVSSGLDIAIMVLGIVFSETMDVASVDHAKIHVMESGIYTGGVTLTVAELGTTADGDAILFTITTSHRAAVAVLIAPELTIEPEFMTYAHLLASFGLDCQGVDMPNWVMTKMGVCVGRKV